MRATTPVLAALPAEPPPFDSPAWRALLAMRGRSVTAPASPASSAFPTASVPSAVSASPAPSTSSALAGADTGASPPPAISAVDEAALDDLYQPLCARAPDRGFAIAHLAQSLDGRIATIGGVSRWLSGDEDLLHTHRMRALADAVVVGVSTVLLDDPQLTVRRCAGRHPVRVVIDPELRLDGTQRVFTDGVAPTLVIAAADRVGGRTRLGGAEVLGIVRSADGPLDPRVIRRTLAERGLHWLFVEGGGTTVSRFLRAGALDRLQLTIAPVILGSGRPAIDLPAIENLRDSLRPVVRRFRLGEDTMIECVFDA